MTKEGKRKFILAQIELIREANSFRDHSPETYATILDLLIKSTDMVRSIIPEKLLSEVLDEHKLDKQITDTETLLSELKRMKEKACKKESRVSTPDPCSCGSRGRC